MSSKTRRRSVGDTEVASKKIKKNHLDPLESYTNAFFPNALSPQSSSGLSEFYTQSTPYKHAVIGSLFNENLLHKVQTEILGELSFTEKETDIYKVRRSSIHSRFSLIRLAS